MIVTAPASSGRTHGGVACERTRRTGGQVAALHAAGCSVRELDGRWDHQLQASGLAGDRAARARLIARHRLGAPFGMLKKLAGHDERFLGPVREMNMRECEANWIGGMTCDCTFVEL